MRPSVLLLLCVVACQRPTPTIVTRVDTVRVADTACARVLHSQRVLDKLTELQAKRYAAIVARDPSQSRFLVGWMNRAFTITADSR